MSIAFHQTAKNPAGIIFDLEFSSVLGVEDAAVSHLARGWGRIIRRSNAGGPTAKKRVLAISLAVKRATCSRGWLVSACDKAKDHGYPHEL
jgi:hypothetical protein